MIDYLVRHPNIFIDTSGVRRFELLEQAAQRAGAHKILFGSDGPWLHPGVELAKVKALRLSKADEAMVLCGHFLKLISKQIRRPDVTRAPVAISAPPRADYRDPWMQPQFM